MPELWRALGLHGEPRKSMRSPFREDTNDSFSVFQKEGKWYFKDHNPTYDTHHGDEVTLIELAKSIPNADAIRVYHQMANVPWGKGETDQDRSSHRPSTARPSATRQSVSKSAPKLDDGAPKKPAKQSDYRPDWSKVGQIVKVYDYLDAEGEVLHQTFRFDPKTFRQRRRPVNDEKPAEDGWVYFLDGIEPLLYCLPDILAADEHTPIFFVEGEKDADSLREMGLLATTTPMGAGKWRESYTKTLSGKWIVVLGDNDSAGRKHVYAVCEALNGNTARLGAIYLEQKWAACPDKGDVTDWLDFCKEAPDALELADSCELDALLKAAKTRLLDWAEDARTPEAIRYAHCFGYGERGAVKVYQDALADVLVDERGVKFAGEVWWHYEKTRWKQLEVQRDARRWIMDAVRSHEDARDEMSSYMISSVEELMANRCSIHPDKFNTHNPDLINVANGMLNIRDFSLLPHSRDFLSTVQLPHRFDEKADCPTFKKWLEQMLPADDTREQIQEIFGYCLAPGLNYHKFFFFYGDGGTGKSTCVDVLTHLVGADNSIAIRLQDLDNAFVRSQLVGKRLYVASELNRDSLKHIDLVKAITSGDPIHVEKKHKDGYTYRPQGRFVMASNVRAATSDTTDGFFRRLCQITWENKIAEADKDYGLLDKFKAEMDGILFWSLQGLQRLMARGRFLATADSQKAADMIQMHRASAKSFFDKCVKESSKPDALISSEALFVEYKRWCEWEHVKPHFESHDYLSRELLNRIPALRERRKRAETVEKDGERRRRMCYTGLCFAAWEGKAGMDI